MKHLILTLVTTVFMYGTCVAHTDTEKSLETSTQTPKAEHTKIDTNQYLYTWEVETESGLAKGTTLSLDEAYKMIDLISGDEIAHSKVIVSESLK